MSSSCARYLKNVVNQLETFEQSAAQYHYVDGKSVWLFFSNDSV